MYGELYNLDCLKKLAFLIFSNVLEERCVKIRKAIIKPIFSLYSIISIILGKKRIYLRRKFLSYDRYDELYVYNNYNIRNLYNYLTAFKK